jgi:hypothetical protein
LKVAQGGPKAPFAVIRGEWNPMSQEDAVKNAQDYLDHPDWKQIGYDPERHGYFYDRASMEPIHGAEEVIQIGPLVLAKKPTYGKKADEKYAQGGVLHMADAGRVRNAIMGALTKARELAKAEATAAKTIKGAQDILPAAEREANLAKFLKPSAEKRRMYHGSKEPNIKEFKTRKDLTDDHNMTGHYADERDAVFLAPEPEFTTHFSKEGYTDTHQAPTTYPVYVQVEKPFDFDNPEHLKKVKESYTGKFL